MFTIIKTHQKHAPRSVWLHTDVILIIIKVDYYKGRYQKGRMVQLLWGVDYKTSVPLNPTIGYRSNLPTGVTRHYVLVVNEHRRSGFSQQLSGWLPIVRVCVHFREQKYSAGWKDHQNI